jgi:hypothetical protein
MNTMTRARAPIRRILTRRAHIGPNVRGDPPRRFSRVKTARKCKKTLRNCTSCCSAIAKPAVLHFTCISAMASLFFAVCKAPGCSSRVSGAGSANHKHRLVATLFCLTALTSALFV